MFLHPQSRPLADLRPAKSRITPNDWEILSQYWYPVAESRDVGHDPVAVRLLDVELVIYRSNTGITAALDSCPHRHIRLSAGRLTEGHIVCIYHALAFDGEGRCTHIPAVGKGARIPESYRLRTFPVQERYGLIWTNLSGGEKADMPYLSGIPDDGSGICFIKTRDWPVSAARQVENFVDLGHLPVVHSATLGNDETTRVVPGKVVQHEDGVALHAHYIESPFGGDERPCEYIYRIILPFAIDFTINDKTGHSMKLYEVVAPLSAHRCRVFQFMKDTRDVDENHRQLIEGLDAVNLEDIAVLENLMQPDLPLNAYHELHLQVDNISHAYRHRLVELGLGQGGGSHALLHSVSAN